MDWNNWKIRCSSLGVITGDIGLTEKQEEKMKELLEKDKIKPITQNQREELNRYLFVKNNPELSTGAKTYLEEVSCYDWGKDKDYPFIKEVVKGNMMEQTSIELVDNVLYGGEVGLYKNTEKKSDDFIEGECDIDFDDTVIDVKTCLDSKTFRKKLKEGLTHDYIWQLKGYARLYNKKRALLCYTLVDTPNYAALQAYFRGHKMDTIDFDCTYAHIPEKDRVIAFEVQLEDSDNKLIEERVAMSRKYISDYENRFFENTGKILK